MVSIKDSLDKLELYLLELEEKYIDTHDDPLEDPDKYKLDVRSYCVLSHAAFGRVCGEYMPVHFK